MRQTSRGKQLRPMFDSLDLRIAPATFAAAAIEQPPAETSTSTDPTSINPKPKGGGGSTTQS